MSTVFNQVANLVENYKGYVEILEPGATPVDDEWFRPEIIIDWTVLTIADSEKHYGHDVSKKKTSLGNSSVYELKIYQTAELYDTADPSTLNRTITKWRKEIHGTPADLTTLPLPTPAILPTLPVITLRGVSESNAAADEFIVTTFTATVERISELQIESDGTGKIIITGEILGSPTEQRVGAAP